MLDVLVFILGLIMGIFVSFFSKSLVRNDKPAEVKKATEETDWEGKLLQG